MFVASLSNSRGDTFDTCGWKYLLQYVEYKEGDTGPNTEHFPFGNYIHKVFELGWECEKFEDLVEIAIEQRSNYKFTKKEYQNKIKKSLENFWTFNQKLKSAKTLGVEVQYSLPFEEGEKTPLTGVIDRVVEGSEGGILVIDYKTGKREKKKHQLFLDNQMRGYAFAANKLYGIPLNKITVAHYYPITGNFVHVKIGPTQIKTYLNDKKQQLWRIRKAKKNELCPQENQFCNWCEFKSMCPLFNTPETVKTRIEERARKAAPWKSNSDNQDSQEKEAASQKK